MAVMMVVMMVGWLAGLSGCVMADSMVDLTGDCSAVKWVGSWERWASTTAPPMAATMAVYSVG